MFVVSWAERLLLAPHFRDWWYEFVILIVGLENVVFWAIICGLAYLAAEPYVRRLWPQFLISWTRLLGGGFRDPIVGRDLLVGALAGCTMVVIEQLSFFVRPWMGRPMGWPMTYESLPVLSGGVTRFATLVDDYFLFTAIKGVMLLLLMLLVFKRRRVAATATAVIWIVAEEGGRLASLGDPVAAVGLVLQVLQIGLAWFVALRFGLLALVVMLYFLDSLFSVPITLDTGAWWADVSWLLVLVLMAVAIYGFRGSTLGSGPVAAAGVATAEPSRSPTPL